MKRWFIKILFLFVGINLYAGTYNNEKVAIISVPKAGTNLIKVIIDQILDVQIQPPAYPFTFDDINQKFSKGIPILLHTSLEKYLFLENNFSIDKRIFLIRDPRDVIISAINYVDKFGIQQISRLAEVVTPDIWQKYSFNTKVELLIDLRFLETFDSLQKIIDLYYSQNNNLLLKYDELIDDNKINENMISIIAEFLNIKLSPERIKMISEQSFGSKNSWTFNTGKKNRWKSKFDEELKQIFKNEYGDLLLKLGFEKDYNW